MADIEDIGTISGIGNFSPSGGVLSPNDSPYLSLLSSAPEYQYFTAPLSNKGNPTSYFTGNNIAVGPDTPIRVVDLANNKVIYEGVGYAGAQGAINAAQDMSTTGGNKANWNIQIVPPESNTYQTVAHEKPNESITHKVASTLGDAALGLMIGGPVGAAIAAGASLAGVNVSDVAYPVLGAMTPLGPIAGAAAGSAVSSTVQGRSLEDTLIRAGLTAATAGILEKTGLGNTISDAVSDGMKSIGFKPLVDDVIKNVASGALPKATGDEIIATAIIKKAAESAATGATASTVASLASSVAQSNPGYKLDQNASSKLTQADPNAANTTIVTGTAGGGTGSVAGLTGAAAATAATNNTTNTKTNNNTNDQKEIVATAQTGAGTPVTASLVDAAMNIDPNVQKAIDDQLAKDPKTKGLTTADLIKLGLLTPSLIQSILGLGGDGTTVGTGGGGTVSYTPLNRTQNVATGGGNAGLGAYGFNPFTYGQATGNQPGEYLFFGKPGTTAGIGGGTAGGTSGGTAGGTSGGTAGGTTGGTNTGATPGGSVTVGYTQKIGDKQVVDGKTYVWGGTDKGWQWLATDNNGNQVLMPGNGATSVSSIEDMFKSGVARPANEAEKARLAEIDRIMAATEAAPTAAAARAINPSGVYFDIDQATAAALGKPELAGTQMSQRDLLIAKQAADDAARAATAAQIPTQVAAVQAAPTKGLSAQSYYNDYVAPLASSYYSSGKLNAEQARGLTNAAFPYIATGDLSAAQNAVNAYLTSNNLAAPVTAADGGLIEYRKGGKAKREKLTYADLSPEEKNAVDYHRRNMAADMVRRNDDGSGSSYIGVINELNGKETYYPTFWNGRELPREEAEKRVRQSGIAFPTYPDYETGLKRERQIHDDIMAPEMARYLKGDRSFLEGYADGGEMSDDMVNHLIAYRKNGGHEGPGRVKGIGSGQEDKIPAWLSDGEYVWSAQDVADLGDGSTDEGVRRLDKMREMVRKQAGRKDVKKIAKPQQGIDKMLKAVGGKA